MNHIRIGSRGSRLALIQAEWVKKALQENHAGLSIEIVIIKTKGDMILDRTLDKIGGKGLFVKEIQAALLEGAVDLAVHSMKDVPGRSPDGLFMAAVTEREDPRDVLITESGLRPEALSAGSVIGTSSLRRQAQILRLNPGCRVVPVRGNVQTRLQKMKDQGMTGIILAAAGLKRLDLLDELPHHMMETDTFVPAAGQGALGCEIRESDERMKALLASLDHDETRCAVRAERAFLNRLEGNCHVPVGAYGHLLEGTLYLTGMTASADGKTKLQETMAGPPEQCAALGIQLAESLILQGAFNLIRGGAANEHESS